MQAPRSFRHEYGHYLENEIEAYKDSLPRMALLALGDEAANGLRTRPNTALTDIVLCDEVNRLIARRLKLPSYRTWRRRYMTQIAALRQPAYWGLDANATLVRELTASSDGEHVLVAGVDVHDAVIFSAALGCSVTTVGDEPEAMERTVAAAEASGLGRRVRACVAGLDQWMPDAGLRVVLCSTGALAQVGADARAEVIDTLQRATLPGGTHFVRAPRGALTDDRPTWVRELELQYVGWATSIEDCGGERATFVARKMMP